MTAPLTTADIAALLFTLRVAQAEDEGAES
jgi:hypothetical protein